MILNIVTPSYRPENIELMIDSIKTITNMDVLWHICFDSNKIEDVGNIDINHKLYYTKSEKRELSGNKQRNLILDNIEEGFIFFLDDDNIIHPNFNEILLNVKYGENYIFKQIRKNGDLRFKPHNKCIYPGRIDTAQILVSSCNLDETTFWTVNYYSEYPFIYNVNKIKPFIKLDIVGSYYNYLRPNKN